MTKLPDLRDYWRISSFSHIPCFGSIFTLNRFQHLMDSLNLANNENSNCKEQLFKLGILLSKSHKYYIPKQEFAIDEQMIGTKYWVSFIQFMPQKPCQLKRIWALWESGTGYVQQSQIYNKIKEGNAEQGLAHRVVMDLMAKYQHQNCHLYMDNFYSSPQLLFDLVENVTFVCGKIREANFQSISKKKSWKVVRVSNWRIYVVRSLVS